MLLKTSSPCNNITPIYEWRECKIFVPDWSPIKTRFRTRDFPQNLNSPLKLARYRSYPKDKLETFFTSPYLSQKDKFTVILYIYNIIYHIMLTLVI